MKKYTVEVMIFALKKLKCKVYNNKVIISELTREQKQLTEKLSIIVPKTLGI